MRPESPEPHSQLEVENQFPIVSLDDVSHKHDIDPRYKSGKSWHFMANFNPEDITYHHSIEDFLTNLSYSGRAHTNFLPCYSNKIHIVCFRFDGTANWRIRWKTQSLRTCWKKRWMPGKTATGCEWIRVVGGLRGHHDFLDFSARNLDSEVLRLELFGRLGAKNAGRSIDAAIDSVKRARNVLSHYSSSS